MASTPTHFASGTVFETVKDIYIAPSTPTDTMYEVNKLVFTNTATTIQTVAVWRNDGIQRLVETFTMPPGKTYIVNSIIGAKLAATHKIAAISTDAGVVNFQIDGKTTG